MAELPDEVFKILTAEEWSDFSHEGCFFGSDDDRRDGFIHLSFGAQLQSTLETHFAGQSDLVIVRLSRSRLEGQLKLERSRGGQLFPHLYRELRKEDVLDVQQEGYAS